MLTPSAAAARTHYCRACPAGPDFPTGAAPQPLAKGSDVFDTVPSHIRCCARTVLPVLTAVCALALTVQSAAGYRVNTVDWRIALVIGNGDYRHSPIPHAEQDAVDMADRLHDINFTAIRRTNVSRSEMRAAFAEFKRQMHSGRIGLFFYTGHGIQFEGRNYLVPLGAELKRPADIPRQCVALEEIWSLIREAENETTVVMMDASYDKPFGYDFVPPAAGLAPAAPPPDCILSFSNLPHRVSDKVAAKNGVYTAHALENMLHQEDTVEMFCKRLRIDVTADTGGRQIPYEISTLRHAFFLNPPRTFLKLKMKKKRAFSPDPAEDSDP